MRHVPELTHDTVRKASGAELEGPQWKLAGLHD